MAAMVDTVAREKPALNQLHTMADMVDMDMEVMVDTVAREKQKLPQLHTMADMVDMVMEDMVDTEDTVDIVESVMPNHTMVMEVVMADMDGESKPTIINLNPRLSRQLSTSSH